MDSKKNLFLTGDRGVGKTTLLEYVVQQLPVDYDGFSTGFGAVKDDGKTLYIRRRTSKNLPDGRKLPLVSMKNNGEGIKNLAFETNGVDILNSIEEAPLILMDECGKFEDLAPAFQKEIFRILDGKSVVFGVLRTDDKVQWIKEIKARQDTEVITVTKENRDELKVLLIEKLQQLL